MEEIGTVLKIEENFAYVEVQKGSECKACSVKEACPDSAQEGYKVVRAKNPINSGIGDKVLLECKTSVSLISSFLVFIMPVLFAIGGYFLGVLLFGDKPEYKPVMCSIGTLILSFLMLRYIDKIYISKRSDFIPVISQKIE